MKLALVIQSFLVVSLLFAGVSLVQAETYTQNQPTDLIIPCAYSTGEICSNSGVCNISIQYNNGSYLVNFQPTTNMNNGDFKYSLDENDTSVLGDYNGKVYCIDGSYNGTGFFTYSITTNGNEKPTAGVIVLFTIIFLIIIIGLISLLMYTIFHMIQWDFDAKDLIYNVSIYIATFAVYILSKEYLGNAFINDILVWLVGVGAITTIILPIIAFVMSFIRGGFESNEPNNGNY